MDSLPFARHLERDIEKALGPYVDVHVTDWFDKASVSVQMTVGASFMKSLPVCEASMDIDRERVIKELRVKLLNTPWVKAYIDEIKKEVAKPKETELPWTMFARATPVRAIRFTRENMVQVLEELKRDGRAIIEDEEILVRGAVGEDTLRFDDYLIKDADGSYTVENAEGFNRRYTRVVNP